MKRKKYTGSLTGHTKKTLNQTIIFYNKLNAETETDKDTEKARIRREEAEKILSQFRSLTTAEQEEQRKVWSEELKLVKLCHGLKPVS